MYVIVIFNKLFPMLNVDHGLQNLGSVSDLLFPHLHVRLKTYIIVKRYYLMIGFRYWNWPVVFVLLRFSKIDGT